jgi:hypothetical protein
MKAMKTQAEEITFKKLVDVIEMTNTISTLKKDPLTFGVLTLRDNLEGPLKKYQKKVQEIKRETTALDEDGCYYVTEIYTNPKTGQRAGGEPDYNKMTPESDRRRESLMDALLKEKVMIEPVCVIDHSRLKKLPLKYLKELNGILFQVTEEQIMQYFSESETVEKKEVETKTDDANGATA